MLAPYPELDIPLTCSKLLKWAEWLSSHKKRDVTWRDVTWRDVTWRDVTWRDVTWRQYSTCATQGVSPCGPMAEGHGDSAPQGALKVALSGTLDRAGVLVGGSVAWFRFARNCTWAEGESKSALSLRYPTTKSYLPSRRAFCPLGDAALSFTTVL